MKVAIYSRKSKFTGKGDSVENQVQLCSEYAKNLGVNPTDILVYEDEGFSGKNINRPQFIKMMEVILHIEVNLEIHPRPFVLTELNQIKCTIH